MTNQAGHSPHGRERFGVARRAGVPLATLTVVLLAAMPVAAQDTCRPWTGEVSPLPTSRSRDALAARWAVLRASELARLAEAIEDVQPATAYHIWRHVECLDPDSSAAGQRAAALRATVSYRDRPFVILPKPPRAERRVFSFAPLDRGLAQAEELLNSARFQRATEVVEPLRSDLSARFPSPERDARLARLETIAATAWIALGDLDSARDAFARALDADPSLELDPATTPPKIRRLLTEVRDARGPRAGVGDGAPNDEANP
jgi:tetratricopeptide (TPR) repeat protein